MSEKNPQGFWDHPDLQGVDPTYNEHGCMLMVWPFGPKVTAGAPAVFMTVEGFVHHCTTALRSFLPTPPVSAIRSRLNAEQWDEAARLLVLGREDYERARACLLNFAREAHPGSWDCYEGLYFVSIIGTSAGSHVGSPAIGDFTDWCEQAEDHFFGVDS